MQPPQPHDDNSKLDGLVAQYLEAIERGEQPDRQHLLLQHSDVATELQAFFTDLDRMQATKLQAVPELDATSIPKHEPKPGAIIGGRYKLLENIGEGGMGSVWVAEQKEPVKRRVAIKLVKAGMDSKQILARFEAERQALAMMDHPNIAKVFDGGMTDQGRPYFVMEYVKGVPFTEYCDKARLSLKDRLNLFIPVCQAVQHAHHKGIVHRDLKPSNILICLYDGKPVPKVIDFGLAKAMHQQLTEQSYFTGHGVMVGTPLYMSPEQAEHNNLDVDTRTDIYSLGVVLYELLTGTTPLEREQLRTAAYNEVLRLIKEVEPPRPSTRLSSSSATLPSIAAQRSIDPRHLQKSLAGDLDWIVMKSLEKERSRRYETANGFVRDIERFLNDEPVEACPPSLSYRLKKFVRKHKPHVIAAGALLLTLIAGIIGTSWGLAQAKRAGNRAIASEKTTVAALRQVAKERDARDEQRRLAESAESQTLSVLSETDDSIQELISSMPKFGPRERAYLEKSLQRWQIFADRQGDDERSLKYRAEGHFRVALVWQHLGETTTARTAYERARDIQQKLVTQFPNVTDYQNDLAASDHNLGTVLVDLGETAAAKTALERARASRQSLVSQFPAVPEYQSNLASSHRNLGGLLKLLGDESSARDAWVLARDVNRQLVMQFPASPQYQSELASSYNNLGSLLRSTGELVAARTEYEQARTIRQSLVSKFPAVPEYQLDLASSLNSLGLLLSELKETSAARKAYEQARDIQRGLVDQFPAIPEYRDDIARTHMNLGNLFSDMGETIEARASYELARNIRQELARQFPSIPDYQTGLARVHYNLGNLLRISGDATSARHEYEQARDVRQKLTERFPSIPAYQIALADAHHNLGGLLKDQGEQAAARASFESARDIDENLVDEFPVNIEYRVSLARCCLNLGNLIREEGAAAQSIEKYGRAIEVLEPISAIATPDAESQGILQGSFLGRAEAFAAINRHAESLADWDQAVALCPEEGRTALRILRANARLRAGQTAESIAEISELIQFFKVSGAIKWSGSDLYNVACHFSVASRQLPDNQIEYSNQATEFLRQAIEAGYNTPEAAAHMATDPDLDPLRDREDFKQLLESLPKPTEFVPDASPSADQKRPQP